MCIRDSNNIVLFVASDDIDDDDENAAGKSTAASQASSASFTSCSLGTAIVTEAHNRGATQSVAESHHSAYVSPTSAGPANDSPSVLTTLQKAEIKSYVLGITRQLSANKPASPAAVNHDQLHTGCGDGAGQIVACKKSVTLSSAGSVMKQRVITLQRRMDVLRHDKEAAVNACNDHKREVESLTEQLEVSRNKLASTKQQLQRASAEADRLRADGDAMEAKMADNSCDASLCSMTAAKAEQDLISNLQSRLKASSNTASKQLDQIRSLRSENENSYPRAVEDGPDIERKFFTEKCSF